MADRLWRAQVSIPLDSALPEDAIVNTWHFDGDDAIGSEDQDYKDAIMTLLTEFYQAIDGEIFPDSVGPEATVKMYDMAVPAVDRELLYQDTIPLTPAALQAFPGEVALCLSFKAADSPGVAPARRRGRIFLGPIHKDVGIMVGSQCRPDPNKTDAVVAAAAVLQEGRLLNIGDPERVRWSVYSPTTDLTSPVGDAFNDVLTGWLDDAFDTQRRRGAAPTSRQTF